VGEASSVFKPEEWFPMNVTGIPTPIERAASSIMSALFDLPPDEVSDTGGYVMGEVIAHLAPRGSREAWLARAISAMREDIRMYDEEGPVTH
jgi:hypothetical protein